ncbi:MAG: acyl carrier protein [Bacteroidales bacterium]|jgi:acyl carrier protein|nr:acyl carrier protein [Bacteroidota bacterium]MCF8349414.1 acyl carrier protein [Bacteroidales bacterium]
MNINDFILKVEAEFEDLEPGSLTPETILKEAFTWDSVNALIFLAHVNVEYDVELSANELIEANTIQDLYNLVEVKVINKG